MAKSPNRYEQIIETIFFKFYQEGLVEFEFERIEIERTAQTLDISLPKNIGDVLYSFRYRANLPSSISSTAPEGCEWIIRPAGRSRYRFAITQQTVIEPSKFLAETKIPDATPGIIDAYALSDEQALLAKMRYNRLVDIYSGLTCYSLQNHLRTTVKDIGQVETDEIYLGLDRRGVQYVIPVQAKGGKDKIGLVQIEQDYAMCAEKFPLLVCLPIAAQFISPNLIAIFSFEQNSEKSIAVSGERHYRLAKPTDIAAEELTSYQHRPI